MSGPGEGSGVVLSGVAFLFGSIGCMHRPVATDVPFADDASTRRPRRVQRRRCAKSMRSLRREHIRQALAKEEVRAYVHRMCGRATLTVSPDDIREIFEVDAVPAMPPRFNIAPSQPLLVQRVPGELAVLTWGPKFINAKVETATTKPENRCLVVIDGFYEWRHGDRQPFYFHRRDRRPFAVGGVTRSAEAACAIVTCPAGDGMKDLHSRMPLVLERQDWARWLAGERVSATLDAFRRHPVSRLVNKASNELPGYPAPPLL